jgi:hypothetical protein
MNFQSLNMDLNRKEKRKGFSLNPAKTAREAQLTLTRGLLEPEPFSGQLARLAAARGPAARVGGLLRRGLARRCRPAQWLACKQRSACSAHAAVIWCGRRRATTQRSTSMSSPQGSPHHRLLVGQRFELTK